jgi:hypothetical protein
MHYRNGREAKNGDMAVQLGNNGTITTFGQLHSATPGNDYCNGYLATTQYPGTLACMCDCLHVEDVAKLIIDAGWQNRPTGM